MSALRALVPRLEYTIRSPSKQHFIIEVHQRQNSAKRYWHIQELYGRSPKQTLEDCFPCHLPGFTASGIQPRLRGHSKPLFPLLPCPRCYQPFCDAFPAFCVFPFPFQQTATSLTASAKYLLCTERTSVVSRRNMYKVKLICRQLTTPTLDWLRSLMKKPSVHE